MRMGLYSAKWCLLGLLLVVSGLAQFAAADGKNENGPPTVNECRVHVEAALKQYWSHSPDEDQPQSPAAASQEPEDSPTPTANESAGEGDDQEATEPTGQIDEPKEEAHSDDDDDDEADEHNTPLNHDDEDTDHDDDNETESHDGNAHDDEDDEEGEAPEGEDQETEKQAENLEQKPEDGEAQDDDKSDEDDQTTDDIETQGEADEPINAENDALASTQEGEATTEEKANSEDGADLGVEQGLSAQESTPEEPEAEDKNEHEEATLEVDAQEAEEEEAEVKDTDQETEETEEEKAEVSSETTEEDEDEMPTKVLFVRNRQHIDDILGLDDIGTENDKDESYLVQSTLKELKKTYDVAVKPLEGLYNFKGVSNRVLGDAEVFSSPMVLLIGPWSSGKSSIINYLLGVERTPSALKTAPEPTDTQFTVVTYGEKAQIVSGTEMAADWPYSTVQKFGQGFLDHFRGVRMPHRLLQKVTLVDTPGIIETRKQQDKGYPFNEAFQWFIDRADAIYITFDPAKLEIGNELEAVLDQLKGREAQIRFILNKADTIRRSDVMRVTGQLFWNLSPMLGSSEAPVIYTVSLMTKPFHPGSPARFLLEQEKAFLHDIRVTMDKRVENRIAYTRRHAVRVRNHAKMIDCYLATYYRHKSIFSNRKVVAESITENPNQYSIYAGLSALTNVSRYDLPDPDVYKVFFRLNPLYDFKPLTATCSFFKGCPLDKLDIAIAYDLPELLGKYKKRTKIQPSEWDEEKGR